MFEPCVEYCYFKYNKQYTKECDNTCAYAKAVLESKNKDKVINYLLDILELGEESIAILPIAVEEEKDLFGINI